MSSVGKIKGDIEELSLKLKVWRQKNQKAKGKFVEYDVSGLNQHMSFLEMLDVLNETANL